MVTQSSHLAHQGQLAGSSSTAFCTSNPDDWTHDARAKPAQRPTLPMGARLVGHGLSNECSTFITLRSQNRAGGQGPRTSIDYRPWREPRTVSAEP